MRSSFQIVAIVILTVPFAWGAVAAAEPRTLDDVLAKWEAASQKCNSFDAKLTVWRHGAGWGFDQATVQHGRFYYEAPGVGCYRSERTDDANQDRRGSCSEFLVWNGKETLLIDKEPVCVANIFRPYQSFPKVEMEALLAKDQGADIGWLQRALAGLANRYVSPQRFLPLVVDVRASEIRARFDIAMTEYSGKIRVTALPKQQADKTSFSKIEVLLDPKTFLTVATQEYSPNGRDQTVVREFSEIKINERPRDRDELIKPDLSQYEKVLLARLRPILKHENPYVRVLAAQNLAQLGPAAKDAIPDLTLLLHDQDASVRDAAQEAIKKIAR